MGRSEMGQTTLHHAILRNCPRSTPSIRQTPLDVRRRLPRYVQRRTDAGLLLHDSPHRKQRHSRDCDSCHTCRARSLNRVNVTDRFPASTKENVMNQNQLGLHLRVWLLPLMLTAVVTGCGGGRDPILGFDGSGTPGGAVVPVVPVVPPPVVSTIPLGVAATFGTFGGSAGMTNKGVLTVINGDIGTTAVSTAVTGFHDPNPGCTYTETGSDIGLVTGTIYTAAPPPTVGCPTEGTAGTFAIATAARADALAAYNALVAQPGGPDPGAGNLANLVLTPGVYTAAAGTFMVQGGDLTLDAQGDANATWVFQMAQTLTVGGPGAAFPQNVVLVNGALAKNVFWQVGSAATLNAGGGGTVADTIISRAAVSASTPGNVAIVTIYGRLLSLGASVTMVNTVGNVPAP